MGSLPLALALADIVEAGAEADAEAEAEAAAEAEAETGRDAAAWDGADEEARGGVDRAEEGGRELMSGIAGVSGGCQRGAPLPGFKGPYNLLAFAL
jgi:hypothetical protein